MTFTAQYDGTCGICSESIRKGDRLDHFDGEVVHTSCLPTSARDTVTGHTCPICWEVKSVSGACGCDPS